MSDAAATDRRPFADWSVGDFLDALAAKRSVPGGGAAAGTSLAHAAALGSMVIAFTRGKARYAEHDERLAAIDDALDATRSDALRLADADAAGFESLAALWPLAPDDPHRTAAWPAAVRGAVTPPRDLVRAADATIDRLADLVGRTSPLLRSDLAIAARFAALAAEAAAWNVEMNLEALEGLTDGTDEAAGLRAEMPTTVARIRTLADRIDEACRSGGRRPLA